MAGSWGVGPIAETFDVIARSEQFVPVVVCGRQERLRRRLSARGTGIVLGWTDQMPELMAASDVLVENAGGLTAMEALAAGLPVVTYRPIAGHGRRTRGSCRRQVSAGGPIPPTTSWPRWPS